MSNGDFLTVRYIGYCTNTFRPKYQGICQERDYQAHKDISPDGHEIVKLNGFDPIDLNPYDHIFGTCEHAVNGVCPDLKLGAAAIASSNGKTADDAITRIDQLDIQDTWRFVETTCAVTSNLAAALTIS